jgi:integrase
MLRTKSGLPKHCYWAEDRHGKRRVRFRKAGFTTYLTGTPWSEDFMRQHATALDGVKAIASEAGSARTVAGSVNALCVAYYRSSDFANLKPSTKAGRKNIIETFRRDHGTKPIKGLTRSHISAIIGAKASTPEAANNLLKVLRILLAYAVSLDMIPGNPAIGVKKYRSRGEGFHSWSEDEIARFEARHAIDSRARLAIALLLYTAQRRGDMIRMGWQHIKQTDDGPVITVRQDKTGTSLEIPLHPNLVEVLASVPRTNLTFLMTEKGAPFTNAGFGNWFRDQCNAAGLPQCSAHGLRKAAATRLADAGCSADQIKAITGHKSLAEVARYTRSADQKRLARQAIETLLRGADSERKLSNLPIRLDKTGAK